MLTFILDAFNLAGDAVRRNGRRLRIWLVMKKDRV